MYKYFVRQYPVYYVLLFEINYLAWCWFPFVFFLKGWCQFLCLLLAQNYIFDLHTKKTVTLSWKPGGLIHVLALAIRAPRYKGQISSLTEVVRFMLWIVFVSVREKEVEEQVVLCPWSLHKRCSPRDKNFPKIGFLFYPFRAGNAFASRKQAKLNK